MKIDEPLNLELLDIKKLIREGLLPEVTSSMIYDSASKNFDPEGLFSEEIFGEKGSEDRYRKIGYIKLGTKILHPYIFINLMSIKRVYLDIVKGQTFAKIDPETKDFVECSPDDKRGGTGYQFFLENYTKIKKKKSKSIRTNIKVAAIEKYASLHMIDSWPVTCAAIRDIEKEDSAAEIDEVNKLYATLLRLSMSIPLDGGEDPLYDQTRFLIQSKVNEIYEYYQDMMSGKGGFKQRHYASRTITLASRNVIGPADSNVSSPDDPQFIRLNETGVPLFQAATTLRPMIFYHSQNVFLSSIFSQTGISVPLINKKTLKNEYVEIDSTEKKKFITDEGISDFINRFKNVDFRKLPFAVKGPDKKYYYLYLVYDEGKKITLFRNIEEIKQKMGDKFDEEKVRPFTNIEFLYVCTYLSSKDRWCLITRYPVIHQDQIYSSKMHLLSTDPSRVIEFIPDVNATSSIMLPHYPIPGNVTVDNLLLNITQLTNLNADFDGDTTNMTPIFTKEALDEQLAYYKSLRSVVKENGELLVDLGNDISKLTFYSLTKRDERKK